MEIQELEAIIDNEANPVLIATELDFFLVDSLKGSCISLYEAFWIADLKLALLRKGYSLPAWSYSVGYRHIMVLIMQYIMAVYYNQNKTAEKYHEWLFEAYSFLKESREHYSTGLLKTLSEGHVTEFLKEVETVRRGIQAFDYGPYPSEVFPYDYLAPEVELIAGRTGTEESVNSDIASIIAKVEIMHL